MSGTGKVRDLIAWDSCVFLAYFLGEKDKPLDDIGAIVRKVESNSLDLIVPAIVVAEVIHGGETNADVVKSMTQFCKRPHITVFNVDFRVAELAGKIRLDGNAYLKNRRIKVGRNQAKIGLPDALIVATAIISRASELHTFDPAIIGLSATKAARGLRIRRPEQYMADGTMFASIDPE